jgi:fructokinase
MRIGIDLGGTKIEAIALSDDGAFSPSRRIATPRGDYEGTLDAIAALVRQFEGTEHARVGIGMPGAISPATGLVKNANSVWLNGRPLARDLEARLARPLRFANDANCFALSEATDGAADWAQVVFGVILGTGCGGGIVAGGRVLTGANAIAGEWGHNPLPWPGTEPSPAGSELPGPSCYCGKSGCIESFLSGPGLAADFVRAGGASATAGGLSAPAAAAAATAGAAVAENGGFDAVFTPPEIVAAAAAGDAGAEACLLRYEGRLARALASIINVLDPDAIVLGGGLSGIARLYENVPRLWPRWVFSDRVDTKLLPPRHGDASGVRGAAWLWE